jgi:mycothiol synthase
LKRSASAEPRVGFVLLYPHHSGFEIQLHPRWRVQALELEMLVWAEMQLHTLRLGQHNRFSTIVHQRDAGLISLLQSHGYSRGDAWLYMQRSLAVPIAPIPAPQGFTVRSVSGRRKAEVRATVLGLGFEAPPFVEWYCTLMRAPGYDSDLDLVAVAPDGQFGAFALCLVDQASKVGQLEPVGTAPTFRRLGLARALLFEGLRRMQAREAERAIVIVEAAETAACKLYESVGFESAWRRHTYEMN